MFKNNKSNINNVFFIIENSYIANVYTEPYGFPMLPNFHVIIFLNLKLRYRIYKINILNYLE